MYSNSLFTKLLRSVEMKLGLPIFILFAILLVFPQYAFSISPSDTSNSTSSTTSIQQSNTTSTTSSATQSTTPSTTTSTTQSNVTSTTSSATPSATTSIPSTTQSNTTPALSEANNTILTSSVQASNNTTKTIVTGPHPTSSNITPNPAVTNQGAPVSFTVRVTDTSISPTAPTGMISWSDGNIGGLFNPNTCMISSDICLVSYIPPQNYGNTITITANYVGDSTHSGSSATSTLTSSVLHAVTTTIVQNTAPINSGSQIQFTATLADTSNLPITPTGTISWSDGNIGGTFSTSYCILSSTSCTVSYTPPLNYLSTITISANYGGDSSHSASLGTFSLSSSSLPATITTVIPNIVTINLQSQVQFTAAVSSSLSSSSIPTGMISWNDGNAGGSFVPSSCTVLSGSCVVTYTPAINSPNSVIVTAEYGGDSVHAGSTGTSSVSVSSPSKTVTTVTPNPETIPRGSQVKFTASLTDTSSYYEPVTGAISWSDGNAGGTFNPVSCVLSSDTCTVSYTPSASSVNQVTITATYGGDSTHSSSFGTSQSSIVLLPSSMLLNTDQSYYAYGDVVTLSVNLPGQSLQNIAVGVSNPKGDNIISRTITTDDNGMGAVQFKIPDTYQTGVYQDVVNTIVDGRNYTNSTEFTVLKSHGVTIDSVQITNQQGNPVSMLPKGQNGFIKVSLTSQEKMPALLTLNLFDANQSSLGTTSVKSTVNPGSSQMVLSFFIPSNVQVGLANVFTDVYSDWPANGGTPLTTESCLAADLQDPSTLPVSYVPTPPHSCTSTNGLASISGNTLATALASNQAYATLGVVIQNDTMTFMSPSEAHLLALAYENGTAKNSTINSVGTVNVALNSLGANSTVPVSGISNASSIQFTTLAGPNLQNDPMAMKILQEIDASKRQVANILGNETADKLNQQLVLQQRQTVSNNLKQDLATLEQASASTTPDAAYSNFLKTVSDNRTIPVFQAEFNFMKQRTAVANTAMQNTLNNGGSIDQALAVFNQYATVNHVQMVSLNNELNVAYGLADNRIQSCFNSMGQLTVVNGTNSCVTNVENNSTGPSGVTIVSAQPTDQQGNPVSLFQMGQTGYIKVVIDSSITEQSLITVNLFDSTMSSLGTASAQYSISPGQSEVILPYYVPAGSGTGLASVYANVFTDWPNNGGTPQSNELSYFVGLS
jgi:trimeric autotransporter adhesin